MSDPTCSLFGEVEYNLSPNRTAEMPLEFCTFQYLWCVYKAIPLIDIQVD